MLYAIYTNTCRFILLRNNLWYIISIYSSCDIKYIAHAMDYHMIYIYIYFLMLYIHVRYNNWEVNAENKKLITLKLAQF